jgi:hypothetical protein
MAIFLSIKVCVDARWAVTARIRADVTEVLCGLC